MTALSKSEFIAEVAKKLSLSKAATEGIIGAVFDVIKAEADAGRSVSWPAFGKFSVKEIAERPGRNPATGQAITIPASRKLAFKPSKSSA